MDTSMIPQNLSIIAALSRNRVIGENGKIPWDLPGDLKHFRETTSGHTVIMGRKTYESIWRPLSGRTNIIITRNGEYDAPGCVVVKSLKEALEHARDDSEPFVIGGSEIYRQAIPLAGKMYLTNVDYTCSGDTYFPGFDEMEWERTMITYRGNLASSMHSMHSMHSYSINRYTRVRPPAYMPSESYQCFDNTRTVEQVKKMREIEAAGVCPFCYSNLPAYGPSEKIREGGYWVVTKNQWPYNNTRVHLVLILKYHAERLSEVTSEAMQEYLEHMQWAEREFDIVGGGFGMRFGDPSENGGTVRHLHAHMIVAGTHDKDDPKYEKVRLRFG